MFFFAVILLSATSLNPTVQINANKQCANTNTGGQNVVFPKRWIKKSNWSLFGPTGAPVERAQSNVAAAEL